MHTCQGVFNAKEQRWEALFQGHIIAKSTDIHGGPEYLRKVIVGGFSQKAKNKNITNIVFPDIETDSTAESSAIIGERPETHTVEKEFSINERFAILEDYVDMVAQGQLASALITGEGGLGKSFTVLRTLQNAGLRDISKMDVEERLHSKDGFIAVKGYSTAKGLFRTLYENRKQIIMFDDCDSVLRDPTAVNLLKAALDSYDERIVTWNAEGWASDDDLPRSFEFEGGVIFVSNLNKSKIPQAIRSRAMCCDVSMTRAEVLERMQVIVNSDEFMPDFEISHKLEALQFISENADSVLIAELNLRSLVNVVKARASKPDTWKRLGLYSMANA